MVMFGTQQLTLFIVSGILLNLTPGQDTLYIVGRSVSQGRRAGVLLCSRHRFGLCDSHRCCRVWLVGPAGDLHACVCDRQDSRAPRISGTSALDCCWSALKLLARQPTFAHESDWAIFRAGLLTNVLNPKVALFFMAFLPQFVAPNAQSRVIPSFFLARCSCSTARCGV